MTMSHPEVISCRWQRTISRRRRRMRLRTTAPPKAFLMLKPKRLIGCPLARTKTVKWELERRLPARYTRSNSLFRTSFASRGNFWPIAGPSPLLWREAMTALLAARRQHFAAALGLHTHAKPVCLGAAAFPRLICTLWQSIPPCFFVESLSSPENPHAATLERLFAAGSHQLPRWLWGLLRQARLPQFGHHPELSSVLAARAQGQENAGVVDMAGRKGINLRENAFRRKGRSCPVEMD